MSDRLQRAMESAVGDASALVPVGYAEKSMASLMQLHSELMDEKERRVDELYRRLMDKEQALAELKMYVRLLEDKLSQPVPATQVQASPRLPRPKPPPPPPRRPGGERIRASAKPRPSNGPSGPSGHGAIPSNGSSSAQAASTEGWRAW